MNVEQINKPELLQLTQQTAAEGRLPESLTVLGARELLAQRKTALLCSRTCPGEVILRVYDLARRLRDSDITFIGGFHTPVERDFLHHLLAGRCNVIICPARSLNTMRVPATWRTALKANRLLLLSPFAANSHIRQSAQLAERRNVLVATLADQILLLYAAPGSHTEHLIYEAAQSGKSLLTPELDDEGLFRRLSKTSF